MRWKSKASGRADENRYLRKELTRVKKERDRFKQQAKEAKKQLQQREHQDSRPAVRGKVDVVVGRSRYRGEKRRSPMTYKM